MFARISILLNGFLAGCFSFSCAMRQGYPLSLLIFYIAGDFLSRYTLHMVDVGSFRPMLSTSSCSAIYNFLSANDTIFFTLAIFVNSISGHHIN